MTENGDTFNSPAQRSASPAGFACTVGARRQRTSAVMPFVLAGAVAPLAATLAC